jgi:hypothetical protein
MYYVSSLGEVFSKWKNRLIGASKTQKGYLSLKATMENGPEKSFRVHRCVARCFIGPIPDGMHVAHLDGNTENNSLSNLAIVTPDENESHKEQHGTMAATVSNRKGETNYRSKLTEEMVLHIIDLTKSGMLSDSEVALELKKKFAVDINRRTVNDIKCGRRWKHLINRCATGPSSPRSA